MQRKARVRQFEDDLDHIVLGAVEHARDLPRPNPGTAPIVGQIDVMAATDAGAYRKLEAAWEEAVGDGRLIIEVRPERIDDSSYRERDEQAFRDEEFAALEASIAEQGQLVPVGLRRLDDQGPEGEERYEIVFGHRRVRACRALNRSVRAVLLRADDAELMRQMLIENALRQDVAPIEKARHWRRLLDAKLLSRQDLARTIKVSLAQIANVLPLAELPSSVLTMVGEWRRLGINPARALHGAWEQAGRQLPAGVASHVDAAGSDPLRRADLLTRLLRGAPQPGEGERVVLRDRRGRKWGHLARSGSQLILRFQPDLDPRLITRLAKRLPELYEELQAEKDP